MPTDQEERQQSRVLKLHPHHGPQEEFLSCAEDEALYGGSKGGGKSYALLMAAARQIEKPGYKAIIFRRTYPKLAELIERAHAIFPGMGGKWNGGSHTWRFKSGSTIKFAHVQHEQDKYVYQGHEYHFMGFDQLEEFTESQYLFLIAQNRSTVPGVFKEVRATANPGGIGHAWVFKRFMTAPDEDEPAAYFVDKEGDQVEYDHGDELEPGTCIVTSFEVPFDLPFEIPDQITRTRIFIPSTVYDNPTLLKNDPQYLANLFQLPEQERKALLEGDWHVFAGQFFRGFTRARHVVAPFDIPEHWIRFRCIDYGSTNPFACYWGAVDEENNIFLYREYYAVGKNARENARNVLQLSKRADGSDEKYAFTVADPSIFSNHGHDLTVGEILMDEGIDPIEKGNNERLAGWTEFRERLRFDDSEEHFKSPTLFVFSTCRNFIRTIVSLVHDEKRPEDLDTDGEDHAADAVRYGLMRLRDEKAVEPQRPPDEPSWGLSERHKRAMGMTREKNRNPLIPQSPHH